jgi:hypothetical protein
MMIGVGSAGRTPGATVESIHIDAMRVTWGTDKITIIIGYILTMLHHTKRDPDMPRRLVRGLLQAYQALKAWFSAWLYNIAYLVSVPF